jgi:hypothetical protein
MNQTKLPPSIVLLLVGLILFSLIVSLNLNPTSDITWRMHVASETLAGKEIYRDIIETNPPLWFWASLGWAQIAKTINVSAYSVMCIGIHALAGVAVFALDRLVVKSLNIWERCAILLGFVVAYLFVTIGEIGQREQALLVGSVLWLGLANMRLEGKAVPIWLVLLVAVFGAYGFALKHYFIAIPVVVELGLLAVLKRAYRPIRLETLLLAIAGIVYGIAVVAFAPVFLSRILSLVLISYSSFGSLMGVPLFKRGLYTIAHCVFIVLPFFVLPFTKTKPKLVISLFILMALTALIIALQLKGFRYHKLAAQGTTFILLSLLLGTALGRGALRDKREIRVGVFCLITAAYVFVVAPTINIVKNQGQEVDAGLRNLVFSEPSDKRIAILSVAPEHAFYLLHRAKRFKWSRHYSMWMLPGLQTPNPGAKTELRRIEEFNRVRREFIADLTCRPPDIIVSERGEMIVKVAVTIDTIGYLKQDAAFAAWFDAAYKPAEKFRIFTVWRLRGARPPVGSCPRDP